MWQFLEGILTFESNVVRVGGRSQSERLEAHNLTHLLEKAREHRSGKEVLARSLTNSEFKMAHAALSEALYLFQKFWLRSGELSGQDLLRYDLTVRSAPPPALISTAISRRIRVQTVPHSLSRTLSLEQLVGALRDELSGLDLERMMHWLSGPKDTEQECDPLPCASSAAVRFHLICTCSDQVTAPRVSSGTGTT